MPAFRVESQKPQKCPQKQELSPLQSPRWSQRIPFLGSKLYKLIKTTEKILYPSRVQVTNNNHIKTKNESKNICLINKLSSISLSEEQSHSAILSSATNLRNMTIPSETSLHTVQVLSPTNNNEHRLPIEMETSCGCKEEPSSSLTEKQSHSNVQYLETNPCKVSVDSEISLDSSVLSQTNCNQSSVRKRTENPSLREKLPSLLISETKSSSPHKPCKARLSPVGRVANDCSNVSQMSYTSLYNRNHLLTHNKAAVLNKSINTIQLLHPDWRKVPWKHYFGWTDSHQQLCEHLQEEVKAGQLESIYYSSQEEYTAASTPRTQVHEDSAFLCGPSATSVCEVLEVIRKMNSPRCRALNTTGRLNRWTKTENLSVPGYDADAED